jgi:hypothetical protein
MGQVVHQETLRVLESLLPARVWLCVIPLVGAALAGGCVPQSPRTCQVEVFIIETGPDVPKAVDVLFQSTSHTNVCQFDDWGEVALASRQAVGSLLSLANGIGTIRLPLLDVVQGTELKRKLDAPYTGCVPIDGRQTRRLPSSQNADIRVRMDLLQISPTEVHLRLSLNYSNKVGVLNPTDGTWGTLAYEGLLSIRDADVAVPPGEWILARQFIEGTRINNSVIVGLLVN